MTQPLQPIINTAKLDFLFFALRSLLELQSEETRIAFKTKLSNYISRYETLGLATTVTDEYFEEMQQQARNLFENLT